MTKVLITGADGQLGKSLQKFPINKNDHFLFTNSKELDICDVHSIRSVIDSFKPANPVGILKDVLKLRSDVNQIQDTFWKRQKLQEIDEIIYAITGLFLEVKSGDNTAFPGEEISLDIEAINRSSAKLVLKKISIGMNGEESTPLDLELKNNHDQQLPYNITIPDAAVYSQPYWLAKKEKMVNYQQKEILQG